MGVGQGEKVCVLKRARESLCTRCRMRACGLSMQRGNHVELMEITRIKKKHQLLDEMKNTNALPLLT